MHMSSTVPPTSTALLATMHGMEILREVDGSGRLQLSTELPLPTLAPHEVLIKTAYAGVNRADLMQVAGSYPSPKGASPLPGLEVSGTIAALGSPDLGWAIGDPVCALLAGGGYAAYVAVSTAQLLPVPSHISLKEAACLPEAAVTSAMALLHEARLCAGERVLIHGGTSGLGILMTQIARALGAEVYTTVGSDEKVAFMEQFGIRPINHRTAPFAEQVMQLTDQNGVDIIIDTLGGPQVSTHFSLLRRNGRMVSLAVMEGHKIASASMLRLLTHHLRWSGATLRSRSAAQKAELVMLVREYIWPHLASGAIKPVVDSVFPLSLAEKALAHMQERLHLGKILLEVAPN